MGTCQEPHQRHHASTRLGSARFLFTAADQSFTQSPLVRKSPFEPNRSSAVTSQIVMVKFFWRSLVDVTIEDPSGSQRSLHNLTYKKKLNFRAHTFPPTVYVESSLTGPTAQSPIKCAILLGHFGLADVHFFFWRPGGDLAFSSLTNFPFFFLT